MLESWKAMDGKMGRANGREWKEYCLVINAGREKGSEVMSEWMDGW